MDASHYHDDHDDDDEDEEKGEMERERDGHALMGEIYIYEDGDMRKQALRFFRPGHVYLWNVRGILRELGKALHAPRKYREKCILESV